VMENALAVHVLDVRADFLFGEFARRRLEHPFFFSERRQRRN